MRVAIIALILAVTALGVGSFATFRSLDNNETVPVAESRWSAAECEDARNGLEWPWKACVTNDNCAAFTDLLQAINDNCSESIPWTEAECEQARRELEQLARSGPACFESTSRRCEQYFDLAQAIVDNCP